MRAAPSSASPLHSHATPDATPVVQRIARAAADVWVEDGPSSITFGAVAKRSDIGKSLVSHYFPDRDRLLGVALDGVASVLTDHIAAFFAGVGGPIGEKRDVTEIIGYFIEDLACGPRRSGLMLLEIASLALRSPDHGRIFQRCLDDIGQRLAAIGAVESPGNLPFVMALLIGELLSHCPQQSSPLTMMGLRERIGWCLDGARRDSPSLSGYFLDRIRPHLQNRPGRPSGVHGTPRPDETTATKRERIVLAALDILVESDAMSVAHREIARRAQLPLAATTYHFASKIEILEAAYQHIIQSATEAAGLIAAAPYGSGLSSFLDLIENMVNFYTGDGLRNTLANFHLALSACRGNSLSSFAARAYETEIELVMQQARHHELAIARNEGRFITSMVGGVVLLTLLGSEIGRPGGPAI